MNRRGEIIAAITSLGGAFVHGGLTPTHFNEWWGYGMFFAVASVAQTILALALLVDPFDESKLRIPKVQATRIVYLVGAVGQLVLVAFYALTRTVGIPLFGPSAGKIEAVALIDLVAQGFELTCAAILLTLFWRSRAAEAGRPSLR